MVKMSHEADLEELLARHERQVARLCRRKFGPNGPHDRAQVIEVLRELMLSRISRMVRSISQLGDEAAEATRHVDQLNGLLKAELKKPKKKAGRRGR